jgi:hypothetical protein
VGDVVALGVHDLPERRRRGTRADALQSRYFLVVLASREGNRHHAEFEAAISAEFETRHRGRQRAARGAGSLP